METVQLSKIHENPYHEWDIVALQEIKDNRGKRWTQITYDIHFAYRAGSIMIGLLAFPLLVFQENRQNFLRILKGRTEVLSKVDL
ncbi:MAG: hypothetical protein ACM3JI_04015, partial [Anaerolineae bacterium]